MKDSKYTASFLAKVRETLDRYRMLEGKEGVTVAYSGGKDSVALLYTLYLLKDEYGFTLRALHVNHSIRGEEADRDEETCREFCLRKGIPFDSVRVDVPSFARENSLGTEEAARILRYREFDKLTDGKNVVATAHTASDNLETLIFNLCRGASADGLRGIPPVRGGYVRPLIDATSDEVMALVTENALPYVFDSTNSDESYTRNFIRAKISPLLKEINPSVEGNARSTSDCISKDREHFQNEVGKHKNERSTKALAALDDAVLSRLVVKLYSETEGSGQLSYRNVCDVIEAIRKTAADSVRREIDLPGRVRFVSDREECRMLNDTDLYTPSAPRKSLSFGMTDIGNGRKILITREENDPLPAGYKNVYKLSAKNILETDTIIIRERENGDAYMTKGVLHKVKKLFSDAKIPLGKRGSLPVFCDSKGIFWIPGLDARDDVFLRDGGGIYIFYIETGEY